MYPVQSRNAESAWTVDAASEFDGRAFWHGYLPTDKSGQTGCRLLNVPGEFYDIPVRIPDLHRFIALLLSPLDLWDTTGTKSRSHFGDGLRVRKVAPEMDATDHVRRQRITLDESHHEPVIEAQTNTPLFGSRCSGESDLVHVEPLGPFRVLYAQGEMANSHTAIMHQCWIARSCSRTSAYLSPLSRAAPARSTMRLVAGPIVDPRASADRPVLIHRMK